VRSQKNVWTRSQHPSQETEVGTCRGKFNLFKETAKDPARAEEGEVVYDDQEDGTGPSHLFLLLPAVVQGPLLCIFLHNSHCARAMPWARARGSTPTGAKRSARYVVLPSTNQVLPR
jgi:hypothetical protein